MNFDFRVQFQQRLASATNAIHSLRKNAYSYTQDVNNKLTSSYFLPSSLDLTNPPITWFDNIETTGTRLSPTRVSDQEDTC